MTARLQGIYVALFSRPADPLGLAFWNAATEAGTDLTPLIGTLTQEREYLDRFEGMSDAEMIDSIYLSLFDREADPEGMSFFLSALENETHTIETIAISILDGALGSDLATLSAKIAAAIGFTSRLDTDAKIAGYSGAAAAEIGREYLGLVGAETVGIDTLADEWVGKLLPSDGGGGGGGGGRPTPSFIVSVQDGKLVFEGEATGAVSVKVADGELVFIREGISTTLKGQQDFSGLADDTVELLAVDASDVFAYGADGWETGTGIDLFDFYDAVGAGQSTILLTSGFNPADIYSEDPDTWPDFSGLFGEEDEIAAFQTPTSVTVVAAPGAITSLSYLVDEDEVPVDGMEIGLPLFLSGAADTLSVAGDQGFMLVGKTVGTNDFLNGGDGNDILMAPNSTGTANVWVEYEYLPYYVRMVEFNNYTQFQSFFELYISSEAGPPEYIGNNHLGSPMLIIQPYFYQKDINPSDTFHIIYNYSGTSNGYSVQGFLYNYGIAITTDKSRPPEFFHSVNDGSVTMVQYSGELFDFEYTVVIRQLFDDPTGYDVLTGGGGSDIFIFTEGSGVDVITDFQVGEDQLIVLETEHEMRVYNNADAEGDGLNDDTVILFVDEDGFYVPGSGVVVILGVPDFTYDYSCGCP